jgi:hypothetical protein
MNKKYFAFLIAALLFINIFYISNFIAMTAFAQAKLKDKDPIPYIGVNVRGYYTSIQGSRYNLQFPDHYYDRSFKLISEGDMNHIRYVFYWEAYERNPTLFIEEIKKVSRLADKWGLKVIYDSHQYHTSSWLDPKNGTGFPSELFQNNPETPRGAGGTTVDNAAKVWWGKWWDRNVTDTTGKDGWSLYASFLKRIIRLVDNHKSTLGYEILNEPQIHTSDQWEKVGQYNSFMTNQLRKVTDKTIVYSMNVPISFKIHSLDLSADNLAKLAPEDKDNVVFKISVYGIPSPNTYQGEKLSILTEAGKLAGVPMYIGEWNEVSREEKINENGNMIFQIDPAKSDLNQIKADELFREFKKMGIWGVAFWNWNYISHPTPNFNLIKVRDDGHIQTTKYFKIVEKAISS